MVGGPRAAYHKNRSNFSKSGHVDFPEFVLCSTTLTHNSQVDLKQEWEEANEVSRSGKRRTRKLLCCHNGLQKACSMQKGYRIRVIWLCVFIYYRCGIRDERFSKFPRFQPLLHLILKKFVFHTTFKHNFVITQTDTAPIVFGAPCRARQDLVKDQDHRALKTFKELFTQLHIRSEW